jgi:zinc protease
MPDDSTQLAEVESRYDVGSRVDPPGKAGIAHLVEHMMFQTRPDGPTTPPIFQTILDLATDMNAYTNWDTTHYRMTSRVENLDEMLKIEAMRMFYQCENIPEGEFEREREVVRNEIRAQSKAESQVFQHVEAALYPPGHAYARMIGGNDEQIASITLQETCDFMKKYYTPDRAVLLVAGNVDVNKTIESIEKWFTKIPKREPAPRTAVTSFTVSHDKKEIEADVERPSVWIGFPLPPQNTPEGELVQFGLGRLINELDEKADDYDFAYNVGGEIMGGPLAPIFMIQIELKGMGRLDEALEFAQKSTASAYRGFDLASYEDNEAYRTIRKAAFIRTLEQLKSRTEQVATMVQFSKDFDFDSTGMYIFHELDKMSKFDFGKVSSVVKKYLDWQNAGIVVVKPNEAGLGQDKRSSVKYAAKSDAAFVDPPVDPGLAKRPIRNAGQLKTISSAQRFTMKNGMEVVLLPVHSMPLAAASLIFKNAGDASTPNNPSLASSAAQFLKMPENANAFTKTGINVTCQSDPDAMACRTGGINIYLDVMLKGLERKVKIGQYDQDEIEQWQKGVKESFKLKSTQEADEYVRQVASAIYGPDHPYARTAVETPDGAKRIHKDALDSFRRDHYNAGNATLVIVGDFEPKYAENLARDTFSSWDRGTVDKPVDPTPVKRSGPTYVGVIESKPNQQVTVTLAYPVRGGVDGQEAARRVLSGMLNLRAEDMRFKLGSTYGLYMFRQPAVGPAAYQLAGGGVIGGTIDAERAGETLKELRASFDRLRAGDHFNEDFVRARRKLVSSMLAESTVTTDIVSKLGEIALYGLDTSWPNTLLQQVAAASPAQIKALMASELDPSHEVIVISGDRAHVEKTFADAGITDVKLIEPDYK